jgi:hypothetical protein
MKLLLDPVVNVGVHYLLQIARTRPESKPVQGMERALLLG